ncbi:MAG: TRAP transporter small permease [Pseudomonadota bacterium]
MHSTGIEKFIETIASCLSALAGAALAIMMFLMAVDVICRYIFNSPIPGALELIEYLMAITVPLSIAYCAAQHSHVSVEMVVERLPQPIQLGLKIIITIFSLIFIGVVDWQSIYNVVDSYDSNITSAVLQIPAYPFTVPVAIGMSFYAIFMLLQLIKKNRRS